MGCLYWGTNIIPVTKSYRWQYSTELFTPRLQNIISNNVGDNVLGPEIRKSFLADLNEFLLDKGKVEVPVVLCFEILVTIRIISLRTIFQKWNS